MNKLSSTLISILRNFKSSPKKALSNSYSITNSMEVSWLFTIILALLSGFSNMLIIKYLPISFIKIIDASLEKHKLSGLGNHLEKGYTPDLVKCFLIGILLFTILFFIHALIIYAIKTNLFKIKIPFTEILNTCWLPLIPAVILLFISAIFSIFSVLIYMFFLSLSFVTLLIYQYQHLCNTVSLSKDRLCFICSISSIIFIIILLKVSYSSAFNFSSMNFMDDLFKNSMFNSLFLGGFKL